MSANTIRSVAQQISSQSGGRLTQAQAEQAVRATLKEIVKQGAKFSEGELKTYLEQHIEAAAGSPQQAAPGPVAWDQPRTMADAAA